MNTGNVGWLHAYCTENGYVKPSTHCWLAEYVSDEEPGYPFCRNCEYGYGHGDNSNTPETFCCTNDSVCPTAPPELR
eukprot:2057462-Prymnesium_polylepis.1